MAMDRTRTLVEAAGNGDTDAMEQLVARHLPRLHAYVRLQMSPKLRRAEGSVDVVQSVCRELLQGLHRFEYRGEGSFLNWLFTAAVSKMRERARYHSRQKRDVDRRAEVSVESAQVYAGLFSPSQEVASAEAIDRIEGVFDRLPDHYREVITLTKIAGVPYEDVAEHLGKSPQAMRMLLGRAMRKFAEELRRSEDLRD